MTDQLDRIRELEGSVRRLSIAFLFLAAATVLTCAAAIVAVIEATR